MLQSIKGLYGKNLAATDGDIGQVKDFYFDDQNWAIRYLVADTGTWLPGRKVLLSPYFLSHQTQLDNVLQANMSRKQIEDGPSIDSHKPVSRQYEEEYHRYYGWPFYWEGSELWGLNGFPISERLSESELANSASAVGPQIQGADSHLRSTQAIIGYNVGTPDGIIGHISDFVWDTSDWSIRHLVVKTGHRLSGKEVLLSPKDVERISFDESTVFVSLTKEVVESSPVPQLRASDISA